MTTEMLTGTATADMIRPFTVDVPEEALDDLRGRVKATRWPDKETVADASQGAPLDRIRALAHYWASDYDWRRFETRLNALPQFVTNIDGLDIHFIHVRSQHEEALPLIMTHGWPGSIAEFLRTIGPLTDPTARGGRAEDAFHLVLPSLPGYGFSQKPTSVGWDPDHIAQAWDVLMRRLGYAHYVAQGGDWGAAITETMGLQAPGGLRGIHVNLPAAVPMEVAAALGAGTPPTGLSGPERAAFDALVAYRKTGSPAYFDMLTARPQAMGYGTTDSPVGLAAFLLVHPGFSRWQYGADPAQLPTRDDVLDDFTLYWLTNTATSAGRLYWENHGKSAVLAAAWRTDKIAVPVAITMFPDDVYRAPESWARRAFPTLRYFHEVDRGGHFAAWEQPQLFTEELREAFGPSRQPR
jgi:pimeloyl-ACP methyl ester carboxylesterase